MNAERKGKPVLIFAATALFRRAANRHQRPNAAAAVLKHHIIKECVL
jgi:hypothetical protein